MHSAFISLGYIALAAALLVGSAMLSGMAKTRRHKEAILAFLREQPVGKYIDEYVIQDGAGVNLPYFSMFIRKHLHDEVECRADAVAETEWYGSHSMRSFRLKQ